MHKPGKLGALLKEARLSRGLNQHELAKLSGVAQASISQAESGYVQNPNFDTLKKLLNAMDFDLEIRAVPRK